MSRRTFLAATVGLVVAACSKNGSSISTGAPGSGVSPDAVQVLIAAPQLVSGAPQRVTVGLVQNDLLLKQQAGVTLAFGRDFSHLGPSQPAELHFQGISDHPYYKTQFAFDQPGNWVVQATVNGKTGSAALDVTTPSDSKIPLVGQKMIPIDSPTVGDNRGVNPICTRDPVCPFHQHTVAQALQSGHPVAVIFATPALCQSRVCGPVLDVLIQEAPAFAGRVEFVHVEVYKSLQTNFTEEDLSPGMKAYNLTFEPVLFLAGADGTVRSRLDGPYDVTECHAGLSGLVQG